MSAAPYEVVLNDPNLFIEEVTGASGLGTVLAVATRFTFAPAHQQGHGDFDCHRPCLQPKWQHFHLSQSFTFTVTNGLNPTIVPTIAACPQDSSSQYACEKICAFGTAVYEVTGIPPTTPVTWSVQGAESFTPNGNSVLVEWGAPGQGQVSVVAGGGSGPNAPFQFFCGQQVSLVLPTNLVLITSIGLMALRLYNVLQH
ncbi:MAG: hypothetical protein IPM82_05895 [Saprospiraceae bacterium]|nr:hypothetical protein [Saprospiraceae bacterium]